MNSERRQNGSVTISTTKAIATILIILATSIGGFLFGVYKVDLLADEFKEIKTTCRERVQVDADLDKRIEVNKATQEGQYKQMNDKIDNLDKKIDKVIKVLERLDNSAVILTSERKE